MFIKPSEMCHGNVLNADSQILALDYFTHQLKLLIPFLTLLIVWIPDAAPTNKIPFLDLDIDCLHQISYNVPSLKVRTF